MVRRKQFGALLMAAIMSVTGISVPQSAEAAVPSEARAVQDGNGAAQPLAADTSGLKTLAEFDFEAGSELTTGDLQSSDKDKKVRAKSYNGYELVAGKDGGKALKLDAAKKQYLELFNAADRGAVLKGKDEVTISYDLQGAVGGTGWVVYADKDATENGSTDYLGVLINKDEPRVEKLKKGWDYETSASRTRIYNVPTNGWNHWDIVVSNEGTKVYINGALCGDGISKSSLSDILGEDGGVLYLGAANWNGAPGEFGSFVMDNFKIYDGIAEVAAKPQKPGVLAELDFETGQKQGGDFETDKVYATQHNSYEIVEGNGGGKAIHLDETKKVEGSDRAGQYLALTKPDGSPILSGKDKITISYDLQGSVGGKGWVVYADKDANQNEYKKENYVAVMSTNGLEYFYNGRPDTGSDNARQVSFSNVATEGWHHWDIEISYGYLRAYQDGRVVGQTTTGASQQKLSDILGNASILYLGAANWGATPGEFATFTMDNFRIYDGLQVEYLKSLVSATEAKKKEAEMVAGSNVTEQMEVVLPEELKSYKDSVSYASSNPQVAAVDARSGKITALAAGTADITATISIGSASKTVKTVIKSVTAGQILENQIQKKEIKLNTEKAPARIGESGEVTIGGFDARLANHPDMQIVWKADEKYLAVEQDSSLRAPMKAKLTAKQTPGVAVVAAEVTVGNTSHEIRGELNIDGAQVAFYDFEKAEGAQDKERLKNKAAADKYAKAWGGEENNRTDLVDSVVTAGAYEGGFQSSSALRLKDFGLRLNTAKVGSEYTVSAWMKSDTQSRLSMNQSVLALGGFAGTDSWISLSGAELGAGNVRILDSDGKITQAKPSDAFADKEWHLVTVTGMAEKASVYIDGTLVTDEVVTKNPLSTDSSDVYLGISKSYALFGGLVDNVEVCNGARSHKQISQNALKGIASWEQIKGSNTAQDNVTADLVLPKKLFHTDINWKSSDETVLTSAGKLLPPLEEKNITLTAAIPVNDDEVTLTYVLKVPANNAAYLAKAEKLYKTYRDDEKKVEKYKEYTQASWGAVEAAYQAVVDGKALTATELKALVDALEKAEKALVKIAGLKSSYEAVVNAKYVQNDYMEDTWAALQKAQADAKAILDRDAAKASIGQKEIDDAQASLDKAAGALQGKDTLLADFSFEEQTVHPDGGFFWKDSKNVTVRVNGDAKEQYSLVQGVSGKAVSLSGNKKQYFMLRNEEGKPVNVLANTGNAATISYDLNNGATDQVLYAGTENNYLGIFAAETLQVGGKEIPLKNVPTEGWHHWDVVVTDEATKVYVDNTLVGTGESALGAVKEQNAEIYIGTVKNHAATTGKYGTFVMDNLRIYRGCPAGAIDNVDFSVAQDIQVAPGGKAASVAVTPQGMAAEVTYRASYSSDNEEIKVNEKGEVTATANARKGGTVTTTVYCPSHAPIVRKTVVNLKNAAETLAEIGFKVEKLEEKVLPGWKGQRKVEVAEWIRLDKSCKTNYHSDNTDVAVVDEDGVVTAKREGTANISVTVSVGTTSKTETYALLTVGKEIAKFEFSGNLNDSTKGNAASVYKGNIEYEDKGMVGKAVKLTGGGLNLNRNNIGDDYTVSVWLKSDQDFAAENLAMLFLGHHDKERWVSVATQGKGSTAKLWTYQVEDNQGGHYNKRDELVQMNDFCKTGWHNVAIVGKKDKLTLYVDGKAIVTDSKSVNPLKGANQGILLGATHWDNPFGGLADGAHIYNASMTDELLYSTIKTEAVESVQYWMGLAGEELKRPTLSTASKKALQQAYDAASSLVKAQKAEITALMAAQKELQLTIESLVDLDELKEMIAKAQEHKAAVNKNKANYAEASLAVYNQNVDAAVTAGKSIMESEEAWTKEQVKQAKDALVLADPLKVTMPSNVVDPDEWLKENTEWLVSVEDLNTLIKNADDRLKQVRDENNDTYKVYMQVSKDAYCAQLEEQKKAAESLVKTATARKPVNEQRNKLQEAYDKVNLLAETAVVNELQKKITEALKDTGDYDKKHTDKTNKDHIGAFVYTQESRKAVEYAIAKLNELHGKLPLDTTQAMRKGVADALTAFAAAKEGLVEVDYQLYDDAQKALDDAAKLKQEDYTGDSWKAYEATCQALKDLMPDLVTPDQLEGALDTISSARKELISIVDLRGVVEDYKVRYIQEQYTVNSWKDYTKVQAEAEAVLADPAAKADYISFMINKLEQSARALVSVVELRTAIQEAIGLDYDYTKYPQAEYTADSWNAYKDACEQARELLTREATEENNLTPVTSDEIAAKIAAIKVAVDKLVTNVPLQDAITKAEATYSEDVKDFYTEASWNAYQKALADAKAVLADPAATDAAMQEAIEKLNEAIAAMVSPDKLTDVITNAETELKDQTADDFTADSWDSYAKALANAKKVAANSSATSEEINDAIADLTKAKEGLISTVSLKKAIDDANAQNFRQDLYTADSWAAYKKALDDAQATLNDKGSATKAEIENATANLNTAVKNLQRVVFDDTDANAAIRRAEALYAGDYTANSYQAVSAALGELKALLDSEQVTDVTVKPAIQKLNDAMENLVSLVTLKEDIQTVQNLNYSQRQYTAASWKAYSNALAYAQTTVAKADASKSEVAKAVSDLNMGVRSLVSIADLSEAIQEAEKQGYRAEDYTKSTWDAYQAALENARTVIAKDNAERIEVKNAAEALESAMGNFVSVAELKAVIASAEAEYSKSKYTADSWKQYSTALGAAKKAAAKADASESELLSVKETLVIAISRLEVKPVPEQLRINLKKATIGVKETLTLKVTGATSKITYTSSNKKVATVSSKGKVTAKKAGKAKITATTAKGKKIACTITVRKAPAKITLNASKKTLKKGKRFKVKATLPKNTASYKITFTSSNKKVAVVSKGGTIRAVKKGTATITVKTFNKKKATIKIVVK